MSENRNATHSHKTQGPVVLLESTAQLARVLLVSRDDEIWVKLADLLEDAQAIVKQNGRNLGARDHTRIRRRAEEWHVTRI
jgi:hypothetical protein